MLKYFKKMHDESERKEITYEEALHTMLGTWNDNDMTRDMLSIPNTIQCMFSRIDVEDWTDSGDHIVLMAGLYNLLPSGIEYDDNGNRVK